MPLTRKSVLTGAEQCVCHDRESEYGTPEDNFQTIANLWDTYLMAKYRGKPIIINALDVAIMMCQVKVARIATGKATADSFVDLAGYAACAGEISSNMDEKGG